MLWEDRHLTLLYSHSSQQVRRFHILIHWNRNLVSYSIIYPFQGGFYYLPIPGRVLLFTHDREGSVIYSCQVGFRYLLMSGRVLLFTHVREGFVIYSCQGGFCYLLMTGRVLLFTHDREGSVIYSWQGGFCYLLMSGRVPLFTHVREGFVIYSWQGGFCYLLMTGRVPLFTHVREGSVIYSCQGGFRYLLMPGRVPLFTCLKTCLISSGSTAWTFNTRRKLLIYKKEKNINIDLKCKIVTCCYNTGCQGDSHQITETSGEKSISHGKPYKMHFLTYFTL